MSEWISVADRLPEGKEDVLCVAFWHEAWQTMVGWYSDLVGEWLGISTWSKLTKVR